MKEHKLSEAHKRKYYLQTGVMPTDGDEDEGDIEEDPKSIKSPGLNEYESFLSSGDFRVSIIKLF